MNSDINKKLQEQFLYQGLGFCGAITASVTHELNNILGTIDQLSGLLEDLALTLTQGDVATGNQLTAISDRIFKQTARGMTLVKRLNTFAHFRDDVAAKFDIYDAVENLLALMKRLALLKKVELILTKPAEEIIVKTNPFSLLEIIFLAINRILPCTKKETVIEVVLSKQNSDAVITIKSMHDGTLTRLSDGGYLRLLISHISGNTKESFDDVYYNFELKVPIPER